MNIPNLTGELLYNHDCVIIPGFGGFICNYSPARTDKETGTFFPPARKISFNRNLNHNDGLLIREISAVHRLNYGDSRNAVEEFVSGMRKKLDRGEKILFERIGTFINNDEGNIQFEPETGINYHLDSFGLESFTCHPLADYDVRKRVNGNVSSHTAKEYTLRRYVWRAAVLVPVAAAIIFVSVNKDLFRNRIETSSLNPLVTAEFENNKAAIDKSNTEKIPSVNLDSEKAEPALIGQPAETVIAQPADAPLKNVAENYFIITGSFLSEENAGNQVRLLQSEGFNPEIVVAENGFYRVCAMACSDIETAVVKKDSILKRFPGAWISRKK
ncbi:MAG TPA: SPOR domain-containing protein [Bacteroidales bacterium]|nr:SPOR domain-containing protein [Bacteroidales bacterium]